MGILLILKVTLGLFAFAAFGVLLGFFVETYKEIIGRVFACLVVIVIYALGVMGANYVLSTSVEVQGVELFVYLLAWATVVIAALLTLVLIGIVVMTLSSQD